jgi:hypothetical protein
MPCCGGARQRLGPIMSPPAPGPAARRFAIEFEYAGPTALTVTGPVSGRRYRFDRPGARLAIDPRDRPSLARVPKLREVT